MLATGNETNVREQQKEKKSAIGIIVCHWWIYLSCHNNAVNLLDVFYTEPLMEETIFFSPHLLHMLL